MSGAFTRRWQVCGNYRVAAANPGEKWIKRFPVALIGSFSQGVILFIISHKEPHLISFVGNSGALAGRWNISSIIVFVLYSEASLLIVSLNLHSMIDHSENKFGERNFLCGADHSEDECCWMKITARCCGKAAGIWGSLLNQRTPGDCSGTWMNKYHTQRKSKQGTHPV